MKRLLLIPLLLLTLTGCPKPQIVEIPRIIENNTLQNYLDSACRIRAGNSGGSGVCFNITEDAVLILTNRHVIGNNKTATVEFWRNGSPTKKYDAKVIKVMDIDAAILSVKRSDVSPLPKAIPISNVEPKIGDVVYTVGHANLGWPKLIAGKVINYNKSGAFSQEQNNIVFVPASFGGQSGSGVFKDGYIVGLLWGSDRQTDTVAVSCKDLIKRIQSENLFFTADWCVYCKDALLIINKLKAEGFNIRIIDIDKDKNFKIENLPTFINSRGEKLIGAQTEEVLRGFYGKEKVDQGRNQKPRRPNPRR